MPIRLFRSLILLVVFGLPYRGQGIVIADFEKESFGKQNHEGNAFSVNATKGARAGASKIGRLATYCKSPCYYREPFRQQFHFTPEIYLMNDHSGYLNPKVAMIGK